MDKIEIKIDDKALLNLLERLNNRSLNLRPVMRTVAGDMFEESLWDWMPWRKTLNRKGAPDGNP